MGLLPIFAHLFSESPSQLALFSERCLRSRLNTNKCQWCVESCRFGALNVSNRKIVLDTAQCTGCMSCVAACPQDALVSDFDFGGLLNSFQKGADVVVSCIHQAQNHPEEITLPCVGILSKQVLAAMLLSGCRSVTFNLVGCEECRNREVSDAFGVECKQTDRKFSDIHSAKVIFVTQNKQSQNPTVDRRSYLKKLRDVATDVSKQSFLPNNAPPLSEVRNGRRIPLKTQLIRKLLTNLHGDSKKKIHVLFGRNLSINEECNCCPMCKGICPTGAIKIDRSDQGKKIRFEMLDCSGCGLCVEFCKKNALSFESFSLD